MIPLTVAHGLPLPTAESLEAKRALPPHAKDDGVAIGKGPKKTAGADPTKPDPRLEKVAREFEAIFIRNLLKPLENAGAMGKQGGVTSGTGVYGSMMVGALADSASESGGIGLSHLVLEALTRGSTAPK